MIQMPSDNAPDSTLSSDELSARAFGSLQHDVDGGSLSHEFNWRLFGSVLLLLAVFIGFGLLLPTGLKQKHYSQSTQVAVSCIPLLFTVIALLSINVPLYDAMIGRCMCLRVRLPPRAGRVLCRLLFSYLWFRPIWTWTPPFLTGLNSQHSRFRRDARAVLLQHAEAQLHKEKNAAEAEAQKMVGKLSKRPGLGAGPLTLYSCRDPPPSSPRTLPFLCLRNTEEVMLHRCKELEEFDLAATGGYRSNETPVGARPLFSYRSMLENGKLIRSLTVGWLVFGVLVPVVTAAKSSASSSDDELFFIVVLNVAFTVMALASVMLTITAGFWPAMQTSAIIRRSLDDTASQLPMARWLRAQSLEYDRLSIKHQAEFNGTRLAAMLAFLVFGAFMFAALNWCIVKSYDRVDYPSLLHSAYFWAASALLFAILLIACGVSGELVLADYHAVVHSARLRLAYYTAILRPHVLLQQMDEMKLYAIETIRQAEAIEAERRITGESGPMPYDNLMPLSEARTFLAQLSRCHSVLDRLQLALRSWMDSRMFVQRVDCNFQMQGAAWLIGVLVLFSVFGFVFFLVVGFVFAKGNLFADPSILLVLIVAIGAGLMTIVEIMAILRMFDATAEQKKRIARMPLQMCYGFGERLGAEAVNAEDEERDAEVLSPRADSVPHRRNPASRAPATAAAADSASSFPRVSAPADSTSAAAPPMKAFLTDLAAFLDAHDAPPTVLGFNVTPRFMQLLQGYLVSAATTVGATIAAKLG